MTVPETELVITVCKGCKRKYPRVYTRCPYCHIKNLTKAESAPKPKCLCIEFIGDNPHCPIHKETQS